MGIESSKSPLERRNTVARRSQRRSISNSKAKVDKIFQEIKKFKGTEENDTYNSILSELDRVRNDLKRKARELQPQVRGIYETTLKRIDEAAEALPDKLIENQDRARKKQEEQEEKARQKQEKEAESKKKKKKKKEESDDEDEVKSIENEENQEERLEAEETDNLAANTDKRHTVELKFVQIIPPEESLQEEDNMPKKLVSPEEKRKSILKVGGVAVMPGAMMNEISTKSKKVSVHYHQSKENIFEDPAARLNEIIENLQALECQIADFVGRKHGTQFNRIRDKLNGYLAELTTFSTNDEFLLEQIKLCRNYVSSCMTFLEEKAIDDRKYDSRDDVFLPDVKNNNFAVNPIEVEEKLHRLTKTTAI